MFFRFMVERIAMRGRLAQGQRRLCRSCGTLYLYATLPALPCGAFTCRRYRLNLGRPKRRGTPAQALKPALLHASDAALKGPLFHGAADLYSAIDITPFSTSDHPRHPTLEITLPKSRASVTIQSQHHSLRLEPYALPEFGGV